MMLQTVFKMVLFPLCLTLYVTHSWADESTAEAPPPAIEFSPAKEGAAPTPETPKSADAPLHVDAPLATPQTTSESPVPSLTLEESLQKMTVMAKVLNALGPEADESLRAAALNVAEADKANDKEQYQQVVKIFETLYEKRFGKTEHHPAVQGLAESLKKVEVMSKVIEVMNPKAGTTPELSQAAKKVLEADSAGDKDAYQEAVTEFETLYQANYPPKSH